jgi:GYF domain 2
MPETWHISVQDRAYGPYTEAQMEAFVAEGRLAPHSLVARAGETQFRPAGEEPALAFLFEPAISGAIAQPMTPQEPAAAQAFGRHDDQQAAGERAHIIVLADMKSRSITGLEEEIYNLGPAHPILPQAWLVVSELPVQAVRNLLVQKLGKLDTIFVIDATHDKASWFNFGPESDIRIRRIWAKTQDASQKQAAG